jgi:hypothetical protein
VTREESDWIEERLKEARRLTEESQRLEADAWAGYLERNRPARERSRQQYEAYRQEGDLARAARRERERLDRIAREARREEERARIAREEEEQRARERAWQKERREAWEREQAEANERERAARVAEAARELEAARAGNPDLMLSAAESRRLWATGEACRQGRLALAAQDYAERLVRRIAPEVPFHEMDETPNGAILYYVTKKDREAAA